MFNWFYQQQFALTISEKSQRPYQCFHFITTNFLEQSIKIMSDMHKHTQRYDWPHTHMKSYMFVFEYQTGISAKVLTDHQARIIYAPNTKNSTKLKANWETIVQSPRVNNKLYHPSLPVCPLDGSGEKSSTTRRGY